MGECDPINEKIFDKSGMFMLCSDTDFLEMSTLVSLKVATKVIIVL